MSARELAARDPFSAEALAGARARYVTGDDERAALATQAAALAGDGYVVLPPAGDGAAIEAARAALDAINATTRKGVYEFEGRHTHRAYNVVSRTRAFDPLICDRRVLAVIESYFEETPQLSACMGMTLYRGQRAQPLHRDTGHYTLAWPRPPLEVNAIWALDEFTADNGATRFLPASHRLAGESRPAGEPVQAIMPAGAVLIYDGSLWHGGGECRVSGPRRSVNNIYARQWLRQQDNMYLSFEPSEVLALPALMQRLLGYWMYGYTLGVVDGRPPIEVLRERHGTDR